MNSKAKFKPRSFAVVGAGPVGCIVAAFLARGGHDVILCDVLSDLLKPATDPGIIIEGAESLQEKVTATCTNIDALADHDPDVIFITVKANALPLIASAIEGFHREGMYIVSWQNGIDTELELSKVLGKAPVMRAVVNYGCGLVGPAHVAMPFHHPPHYIQELDPESQDAARAIAGALSKSGLETKHTDQIVSMVWRKTVMNASMNPVCAATGLTMSRAMNDPIVYQIVDALVKECLKVARANEINLGWDYYPYAMEYMGSEIDFMNGKFVEYGQQAGIETPYNRTLWALVKGLESK